MTEAYCETCKATTEHRHLHDAAHGVEGTHMAGSERYECSMCGTSIHVNEVTPQNAHLKFSYDKPEGTATPSTTTRRKPQRFSRS